MSKQVELARALAVAEKQRDEWRAECDTLVAVVNTKNAESEANKARIAALEKDLHAAKVKTEAAERAKWEATNAAQNATREMTNRKERLERAESECARFGAENKTLAKLNRMLARRLSQALLGAHLDEVPK